MNTNDIKVGDQFIFLCKYGHQDDGCNGCKRYRIEQVIEIRTYGVNMEVVEGEFACIYNSKFHYHSFGAILYETDNGKCFLI